MYPKIILEMHLSSLAALLKIPHSFTSANVMENILLSYSLQMLSIQKFIEHGFATLNNITEGVIKITSVPRVSNISWILSKL